MYNPDDTTTQINTDLDDDKMQILTGTERLNFFTDEKPALTKPEFRKRTGLISFINKLLK